MYSLPNVISFANLMSKVARELNRKMSKLTSFSIVAFLLLQGMFQAVSRPVRAFTGVTPVASNRVDEMDINRGMEGNSCGGEGEEDCLMRRTLEAHLDYIYTQKGKHR
ncbi:unnamed protein product [Cuscuta epithymum]|uniref:Phytosulfokine n=1 Tax=Cuscuta epithymum TaxID=186058 RepID=A0AAV0D661_9ASTE|nr:unnamed protein product [Cuscuta epithymum]CAH9147952.1 unnamed protein product [Cuscuta epithymum]